MVWSYEILEVCGCGSFGGHFFGLVCGVVRWFWWGGGGMMGEGVGGLNTGGK